MTSRICTIFLLLTACQFDPKDIGDPTGAEGGTDSASSEPINESATTSEGGGSGATTVDPSESGGSGVTTVGTSESGSTSQGQSETTTSAETEGVETEGEEITCSRDPLNFPTFPRACEVDADCGIGIQSIDCCGSLYAVGIRVEYEQIFEEAQLLCQQQSPICDCLPGHTTAQDDKPKLDNDEIGVSCQANECRTFIIDL